MLSLYGESGDGNWGRDSSQPTSGSIVGVSENSDAFSGGARLAKAFLFSSGEQETYKGLALLTALVLRPTCSKPAMTLGPVGSRLKTVGDITVGDVKKFSRRVRNGRIALIADLGVLSLAITAVVDC